MNQVGPFCATCLAQVEEGEACGECGDTEQWYRMVPPLPVGWTPPPPPQPVKLLAAEWPNFKGRNAEILRLRGEGVTYRALAERFDLSVGRITQIVKRAKAPKPQKRNGPPDDLARPLTWRDEMELSVRAANVLACMECPPARPETPDDVGSLLRAFVAMPNAGAGSLIELAAALGHPLARADAMRLYRERRRK